MIPSMTQYLLKALLLPIVNERSNIQGHDPFYYKLQKFHQGVEGCLGMTQLIKLRQSSHITYWLFSWLLSIQPPGLVFNVTFSEPAFSSVCSPKPR